MEFLFIVCFLLLECGGFPDSSVGKESTCNAGDPSSIPGSGRSAGKGISYPLQYSWASLVAQLEESSCSARGLGSIPGLGRSSGEVKGFPLQYSGLENSMDCIVHGVAWDHRARHKWATFTFPLESNLPESRGLSCPQLQSQCLGWWLLDLHWCQVKCTWHLKEGSFKWHPLAEVFLQHAKDSDPTFPSEHLSMLETCKLQHSKDSIVLSSNFSPAPKTMWVCSLCSMCVHECSELNILPQA